MRNFIPPALSAALLCAATASLALAAPPAGAAVPAAEFKRIMPPPGLYRIDTDSSTSQPGVAVQQHQDGASGDASTRTSVNGGSYRQDFKGSAPQTYCMPAASAATLPPELAGSACHTVSTDVNGDSIVHVAQCASGRTTVTVRKLGTDSWAFEHRISMVPVAGAPSLNGLRPMLEQMAQHGTPEQRTKAAAALAQLPQQQAQMDAGRAGTLAALAKAQARAGSPQEAAAYAQGMQAMQHTGTAMDSLSRQRWTRIGNSCDAAKP